MNGQDIKKARKAADVSQTELALALGFSSRHALTEIEQGKIEPSDAWVLKVLGVLAGLKAKQESAA